MLVELTDIGRKTVDRLPEDNAARLKDSFATIDGDEHRQLVQMLNRLCA